MNYSLDTSTYYLQRAQFNELSLNDFYQVAKLRQDVFIIEQQSIYNDLDGLDAVARHYLYWSSRAQDAVLIGYARYRYDESGQQYKIERVVLSQKSRGRGVGQSLMLTMIQDIRANHHSATISLSAQLVALTFYQRLGFEALGDSYDDGGIEHITMHYLGQK